MRFNGWWRPRSGCRTTSSTCGCEDLAGPSEEKSVGRTCRPPPPPWPQLRPTGPSGSAWTSPPTWRCWASGCPTLPSTRQHWTARASWRGWGCASTATPATATTSPRRTTRPGSQGMFTSHAPGTFDLARCLQIRDHTSTLLHQIFVLELRKAFS